MAAGAVVKHRLLRPLLRRRGHPRQQRLQSIRHTTRNFPNREGSKPGEGQIAAVALMDARSIAATAANGGRLTAATELDSPRLLRPRYHFDAAIYKTRVYDGLGKADPDRGAAVYGPNIKDWPAACPP